MTTPPDRTKPRESAWAKPVDRLEVSAVPAGAINLNVEGRQLTGPLQGFGYMWQKTYRVRLSGADVTPAEVIRTWKEKFPTFWPKGARFYGPLSGIAPGEVALINLAGPGGMPLSTGILVIYADEESFTFMTPAGHMLSGWITFSAYEEQGTTVAQAQVLIRANDPFYEIMMRLMGHRKEDEQWHHVLRSVAAHFGVNAVVEQQAACVDHRLQWAQARNIWYNAAIRTAMFTPVRLVQTLFKRSSDSLRQPAMAAAAPTRLAQPVSRENAWARPVTRLTVADVPAGAINLNVEGRQVVGPLQGFGQMWQKTYRVRLSGAKVSSADVVSVWKEHFPRFQPPENNFYPSLTGIKPGEVVWTDSLLPVVPGLPGLVPIASGLMVLYADEVSFTVMTPEGFPESGWNTFSAYEEDGVTVAQVQSIARAADPIYEFGFRFMGGSQKQEKTWAQVLKSLAAHFGVKGQVQMEVTCVDPGLQWAQAKNVWRNAAIRTMLYMIAAPIRSVRRRTDPKSSMR